MNELILNQYKIKFRITESSSREGNFARAFVNGNDTLSKHLGALFINARRDGPLELILENIQKAQDSLLFDPYEDGGPELVSLIIGVPVTTLRSIYDHNVQAQIPTDDLKEIIQSWFHFLEINNLEDRVW